MYPTGSRLLGESNGFGAGERCPLIIRIAKGTLNMSTYNFISYRKHLHYCDTQHTSLSVLTVDAEDEIRIILSIYSS